MSGLLHSPFLKPLRHMVGVNLHRFRQTFLYPHQVQREMTAFKAEGPLVKGSGLCLVILNHAYDQDVQAIREAAGQGQETIWELSPSLFHKSVHRYVAPKFCDLYHSNESPELAPFIRRYTEEFVRPFVDFLIETTHLDVLLTPSDQFFWFRPVISVLREKGVAVVVQDKEGTICQTFIDDLAPLLKANFPPLCDQYVYWNESSRAYGEISGVNPALQTIIGQPRSDYFFQPSRWPSRKALGLPENSKIILFFTFASDAYTKEGLLEANTKAPWSMMRHQILEALKSVLENYSNAFLVIKAHPQQADLRKHRSEINAMNLKRSILLTDAKISNNLISASDAIVGFQTTALIEGMLTSKPVIYTEWGHAAQVNQQDLIPFTASKGCDLASGPHELQNLLTAYLKEAQKPSDQQLEKRKVFVDRYFNSADGSVSRRLLNFLNQMARTKTAPVRNQTKACSA